MSVTPAHRLAVQALLHGSQGKSHRERKGYLRTLDSLKTGRFALLDMTRRTIPKGKRYVGILKPSWVPVCSRVYRQSPYRGDTGVCSDHSEEEICVQRSHPSPAGGGTLSRPSLLAGETHAGLRQTLSRTKLLNFCVNCPAHAVLLPQPQELNKLAVVQRTCNFICPQGKICDPSTAVERSHEWRLSCQRQRRTIP